MLTPFNREYFFLQSRYIPENPLGVVLGRISEFSSVRHRKKAYSRQPPSSVGISKDVQLVDAQIPSVPGGRLRMAQLVRQASPDSERYAFLALFEYQSTASKEDVANIRRMILDSAAGMILVPRLVNSDGEDKKGLLHHLESF